MDIENHVAFVKIHSVIIEMQRPTLLCWTWTSKKKKEEKNADSADCRPENSSLKDAHPKYLTFNISARMRRESAVALPIFFPTNAEDYFSDKNEDIK